MKRILISLILIVSLFNVKAGCPPTMYVRAITNNGCIWVGSQVFITTPNGIKRGYLSGFSGGGCDRYTTFGDAGWQCGTNFYSALVYVTMYRLSGSCEPYNITNWYNTNYYNATNIDGKYIDFVFTNDYYWGGLINFKLDFSYTNNLNFDLMYQFYDPVTGSNYVGILKPGNSVNFKLDYQLETNITAKPFFGVQNLSNEDPPFNFSNNLNWNSSSGDNSFNNLNQNLTPTNKFSEAQSQVVFTNSNFYKITQMTNQVGQTVAKVETLADLGDVLSELQKMNKNLSDLKSNSTEIDSTMAKWSTLTNSMINTNVPGLQNVLNSINSFNPSGVIASNSISGSPNSDFWKIRIPINGKDYWLKIPIDDSKVLNFFSWLNSFFRLAITFFYYLFCVYLAYKLVTDTLQTPAHTVNGAAIMGTHSNFLIAKACLAVVLVVVATVLQQFLSGLIQAPVRDLFIAWQAQTSSVGFLSESFKLFLKVFPVDYFIGYLGSGLAVFFNFWVFKSTLQIIKNAMA